MVQLSARAPATKRANFHDATPFMKHYATRIETATGDTAATRYMHWRTRRENGGKAVEAKDGTKLKLHTRTGFERRWRKDLGMQKRQAIPRGPSSRSESTPTQSPRIFPPSSTPASTRQSVPTTSPLATASSDSTVIMSSTQITSNAVSPTSTTNLNQESSRSSPTIPPESRSRTSLASDPAPTTQQPSSTGESSNSDVDSSVSLAMPTRATLARTPNLTTTAIPSFAPTTVDAVFPPQLSPPSDFVDSPVSTSSPSPSPTPSPQRDSVSETDEASSAQAQAAGLSSEGGSVASVDLSSNGMITASSGIPTPTTTLPPSPTTLAFSTSTTPPSSTSNLVSPLASPSTIATISAVSSMVPPASESS